MKSIKENDNVLDKIKLEYKNINDIFQSKKHEENVTYLDLFMVVQSLLNILNYADDQNNINRREIIDRIYEDMFRLHGYDKNGKRLDK